MGPLDKSDASLDALSVVIKQGTLSLRETVDEEKAQLRLTRPRVFRKTRRFIPFFFLIQSLQKQAWLLSAHKESIPQQKPADSLKFRIATRITKLKTQTLCS